MCGLDAPSVRGAFLRLARTVLTSWGVQAPQLSHFGISVTRARAGRGPRGGQGAAGDAVGGLQLLDAVRCGLPLGKAGGVLEEDDRRTVDCLVVQLLSGKDKAQHHVSMELGI